MIDIQQLTSLISAFRGETFSLTLPIGSASRNQAGVMTAEDLISFKNEICLFCIYCFLIRELQADEGDAGEHEKDADDLGPADAFARGAEPAVVFHQHAQGELADQQRHGKYADPDLGDEPGVAEYDNRTAQAASPHPPGIIAAEAFGDKLRLADAGAEQQQRHRGDEKCHRSGLDRIAHNA